MNRFNQKLKKHDPKPSKSGFKPRLPNKRKNVEQPKVKKTPAAKLPRSLLDSWEQCLIANGRFPKGTRKSEEGNFKLIRKLILGELDSVFQLSESIKKGEQQRVEQFLKTKKGLVSYLLSEHLDQILSAYLLTERVGRKWRWKQLFNHFTSFEITDWTSGTGACAATWADLLIRNKADQEALKVKLIEPNSMLLDGALQIFKKLAPDAKVHGLKKHHDKQQAASNPSELKIHLLGFSWPQFKYDKKAQNAFIKQLEQDLSNNTPSIVSLQDSSSSEAARVLMLLRDELVSMGYKAVYPCPAAAVSCPMLMEEKDWCYSEFDYEPTFVQKSLQKELRNGKPVAKSAAFVFASPKLLELSMPNLGTARVVGRPTKKTKTPVKKPAPREFEYLMCTDKGLQKFPSNITQSRIARRGWDMDLPDEKKPKSQAKKPAKG